MNIIVKAQLQFKVLDFDFTYIKHSGFLHTVNKSGCKAFLVLIGNGSMLEFGAYFRKCVNEL